MSLLSKKTVVVAMSGGVDSSVAALLLKEQGMDVIGISMKTHDAPESDSCTTKTCCTASDIEDARRVCQRLDIPFYAMNFKEEFEKKVIETFGREYSRGRTPNPCVLCNNHLKFASLLRQARKLGAYYLATGHYAQKMKDPNGPYRLLRAKDRNKDQTYFLFGLNQEKLEHILFPLGHLTKPEVRELAKKAGFSTAEKAESQEICFVPNNDYAGFIENHLPQYRGTPGNFVSESGEVLGEHRGIHAYTVGQRRGLGVAMGERVYVKQILTDKNQVVLGQKDSLLAAGLIAKEMSWIDPEQVKDGLEVQVKTRYRQNEVSSFLRLGEEDQIRVEFREPEGSITPGQAVVIYKGDEVLGGGFIESGY